MGLNLSNEQIAQVLDLFSGDVQAMISQLREGVVAKSKLMKCTLALGIKDIQNVN